MLRRAMMASVGPAFPTVAFVASTGTNYVDSGTTINSPSTPPGIASGDGLFAIVFGRSALTPPAGWTLVKSQANADANLQTLYVYRKDAVTTGDASTAFIWAQAASGRMGLAYIVARSTSGTITVAQSDGLETDVPSSPSPQNVPVPTLTATTAGELFLMAATSLSGSVSTNTWTASSGATLRTIGAQPNNRLAAATQSRNAGQSNSSPMVFDIAATLTGTYSSIVVRLQP